MNHLILLDPITPIAHDRGKKWLIVDPITIGENLYLYTKGQYTKPGDICYFEDEMIVRPKRQGEDKHGHLIVAFPEEIGWIFNGGPPHDRNYNYTDGYYLEVLHPSCYQEICDNNFLVHVQVDLYFETGFEGPLPFSPVYFHNKVVLNIVRMSEFSEKPTVDLTPEAIKERKTKRKEERKLAEKVWEEMGNDGDTNDKNYWMAGFVIGLNYRKD